MARLFISHASANSFAAIALRDWLFEQGFENEVYLDIDPNRGMVPGERWQEALRTAADRCEAILFIISSAWLTSRWCQLEFLLAKTLHKRIFGLLIEAVPHDQIPADMSLEWQLCRLIGPGPVRTFDASYEGAWQRVEFRSEGLDSLRLGLDRAGLEGTSFPWPPGTDPYRAPYRGLRPLDLDDAAIFFGRDAAIVRAVDRVRGLMEGGVERLLVILGASGAGKSSFLRAGLWPRLARNDVAFLPLPILRPETAVISGPSGLATALAEAFRRLDAPRALGRIKAELLENGLSFHRLLSELGELAARRLVGLDGLHASPAVVLGLDQAEELFNPEGADEAEVFLDLLASVAAPAEPQSRVLTIATIRSDRYQMLQSERRLLSIKQALFNLPPLPSTEFKTVIEEPARRVRQAGGHLDIDPELTEQLVFDAKGADALPVLAFTLERLFSDFGAERTITLKHYNDLGGFQGSIEAAIAHAFSDVHRPPVIPATKEEQLARLRAAFIPSLARMDPDTGLPVRRLGRLAEIPEESRPLIARLVAARLLVADKHLDVDTIEVAHESLLRQWPPLAAWLQADGEHLKLIEGVEQATNEWLRKGKRDEWLNHRGERLRSAELLCAREDFRRRLGMQGIAYLAACRARAEAEYALESKRRAQVAAAKRMRASSIVLFAAVVLGVGYVGWSNRADVRQRMNLLADLWWPPLASSKEAMLRPGDVFSECASCPTMVVVRPGTFMMGSHAAESQARSNEMPQRGVTISRRFAVSTREVTFDQWDACVAHGGCSHQPSDSGWGRRDRPVINVSWEDVREYVAWISKQTGKPYRLPSEAEWEYSARAGSAQFYSWGHAIGKRKANCNGCGSDWDGNQTAPVASFAANAFGLFDMHGNVWEWVQDCYLDSYDGAPSDESARASGGCASHVLRGGSWLVDPLDLRSANRFEYSSFDRRNDAGFRLARTLSN